jgi:general secretion pathway protein C
MNRLLNAARKALRSLRSVGRIAQPLTRFETTPVDSAVAVLNRRVAYSAAAAGVVAVAYQVITVAAVIVNETRHPAVAHAVQPVVQHAAPETAPRAFDNIADAHLFGVFEAQAETRVAQVSAPDTTLDVKLTGILFGKDPQHREAIISSNGEDRTYRAGQEIDSSGGATVRDVFPDSVLLERQGNAEMLRLVGYLELPARIDHVSASAGTGEKGGGPKPVSKPLRHPRNDFLRLMRKSQDGQMVGFAVMPGPNRDTFDTLGLQSNDVITHIDGVALGDRGDSLLLERLAGGGSLTLTVLRAGAAQEIRVDANRLTAGGG